MSGPARRQYTRTRLRRSVNSLLFETLYRDLNNLARALLRREHPGHPLEPAALVHETYLRLVDHHWGRGNGRDLFLDVAARTMRHVLIDHARAEHAGRRGNGWKRVPLQDRLATLEEPQGAECQVGDALEALRNLDTRHLSVIRLRFLVGLSVEETAQALGVSKTTVEHDWRLAREWLRRTLAPDHVGA